MKNLLLFLMLLLCNFAVASSITLAWSPNQEPDLLGYRIHMGTIPKSYFLVIDAGQATEFEVGDLQDGMRYYFSITAVDYWGNESRFSEEVTAIAGSTVEPPTAFELEAIRPNPMHKGQIAYLCFSQPEQQTIQVAIFNDLGQKVRTVFSGDNPLGFHQFYWDGFDDNGQMLPSGVYFCRLHAGRKVLTRPATLIR